MQIEPISITFEKPVGGYWDGGLKRGGTFDISFRNGGYEKHENLKSHLEVGSWELNFFFRMPIPKNPNRIRNLAIRRIKRLCKIPCIIA
jgi:hypothetical protein